MRLRVIVPGLVLACLLAGTASGEESGKYPLQIRKTPGQKRTYKNLHRISFFADRARELSASSSGGKSLTIDISREWTMDETFRVEKEDTLVAAVMTKGSELAMINSLQPQSTLIKCLRLTFS